ncbi:MAG: class I SAM-dependent methyltransferase [Myxococcales bacterium]
MTGLDLSDAMVREARAGAAEAKADHATFQQGDAQALPFPDASFDVVSSRFVIFTLPRPGVAVREWLRVLRPGGTMLVFNARRQPSAEATGLRAWLGGAAERLRARLRRGDSESPRWAEYERVVNAFPLFFHDAGMVQALLDAAGAVDVGKLDASAIMAARAAVVSRHPWIRGYEPMEIVRASKR